MLGSSCAYLDLGVEAQLQGSQLLFLTALDCLRLVRMLWDNVDAVQKLHDPTSPRCCRHGKSILTASHGRALWTHLHQTSTLLQSICAGDCYATPDGIAHRLLGNLAHSQLRVAVSIALRVVMHQAESYLG